MNNRVVIALGGNALGNNLEEQMACVRIAAKAIVDLIEQGYEVAVCHGNGPQVGMIRLAFETASKVEPKVQNVPLSMSVAMSQGYIGYDMQNALRREMLDRGIHKDVATILTQVVVDENDPAFQSPTKPIGAFYSKEEADAIRQKKPEIVMQEDAGRGYRQMVASPLPVDIVEKGMVKSMMEAGNVVVSCGGGGIPVKWQGNFLKGCSAVVDKDFAGARLADLIDAGTFIILTAVDKVALNYGKPDETWLDTITADEAERYIAEEHFAKGSMLPKVEAALRFVKGSPDRKVLITNLVKVRDAMDGKTGTRIVAGVPAARLA